MNDKERIVRIMNEENMNASQFSESTGIQRAAISHILAGRNNPSLDVIKKILKRFSYINPDWLLSGEGSMKRDVQSLENTDITDLSSSIPNENYGLFSQSDFQQVSASKTPLTGSSVSNQGTNALPMQTLSPADIRTELSFTDEKNKGEEVNKTANETKEVIKETIIYKERPNKTIEKLLIFYSDNTFETFIPEKKEK